MDYEGCKELKDLVSDSSATEFRDGLTDYPLEKNQTEFIDWINSEALPHWGPQYQTMLEALRRLVGSASELDFVAAKRLIEDLIPADEAAEDAEDDAELEPEDDDEDDGVADLALEEDDEDEDDPEEIPPPSQAAQNVARDVTAPVIAEFQREYPEIAARLTPDQLSAMAMRATATVVAES
jgi:hypothetical protein